MAKKQRVNKPADSELVDRLVVMNRVSKVVKGGRRFSFSALVVVGNGNGVVGFGLGKASEAQNAIQKGIEDAKKNLIQFPILKGTVPHDVNINYGASNVMLKPAAPGTGILAGGAMRAMLETAGIKDVLGKSHGSSNPQNVLRATVKALSSLRDPASVAKLRGITLEKLFSGK